MAFLDNSGDIILDAVLTETGRKRMANGNFGISKFALGDDEINYTTYNKNHPSGSAYYDLEILQTPVLEATTQMNSNINYGLLSITNTQLLYMPAIDMNELLPDLAVFKTGSVYYVATNQATANKLALATSIGNTKYISKATGTPQRDGRIILFESGINNSKLASTAANRSKFLVSTDMVDSSFTVQVDGRFIASVAGLAANSTFTNDFEDNLVANLSVGAGSISGVAATGLANYNNFTVPGITDAITDTSSGASQWSALNGPKGTIGGVVFNTVSELGSTDTRSSLYNDYGVISATPFGGSDTYDYIDTVVYVVGNNTSAVIQLPARIIRNVS